MKQLRYITLGLAFVLTLFTLSVQAQEVAATDSVNQQKNEVNVKEIVFGHIGDSYEWHITDIGHTAIVIPLPIIVYWKTWPMPTWRVCWVYRKAR